MERIGRDPRSGLKVFFEVLTYPNWNYQKVFVLQREDGLLLCTSLEDPEDFVRVPVMTNYKNFHVGWRNRAEHYHFPYMTFRHKDDASEDWGRFVAACTALRSKWLQEGF